MLCVGAFLASTLVLIVMERSIEKYIDFYADWCVPCQHLSPIVEEVAAEHPEIKFVKVNVDEVKNIANQYGIIRIPTLVFIKNGEQVGSSIGLVEKEAIVELISQ